MSNVVPFKILSSREHASLTKELSELKSQVKLAEKFVKQLGEGNEEATFEGDMTTSFGMALTEMQESSKSRKVIDEQRKWVADGLANFVDILRKSQADMQMLCKEALTYIVKYFNLNQGGIFTVNNSVSSDVYLELQACYAYERQKYLEKKVYPREGLVGQVFIEKLPIFMTEVPQNYVHITSGLGKSTPGCIFVVPITANDEIYGVLEVASFEVFKDYEKGLLISICENLGATLASVRTTEKMRRLLEETQMQAEQMRAQEEEMRQNMEELQATQEEMQRNQKEVEIANKKMKNNEAVLKKSYQKAKEVEKALKEKNKQFDEQAKVMQAQIEQLEEARADMELQQAEFEQERFEVIREGKKLKKQLKESHESEEVLKQEVERLKALLEQK